MSQLTEIIDGWKNLAIKDEKIEQMAIERLEICLICPKYLETTKRCGICRCFIPAKVRSQGSRCPSKKWGEFNS